MAGGAEEVEGLMMISTAVVAIMAVKIVIIEVEVVVMMMMVVGEGVLVVITTDMMVTAAGMADPQVEGTEMDLLAQVDHRATAYLLPYLPVALLRCVRYPLLSG